MEQIDLTGQVAIVSGAGRGIGRSHALLLAARGASVVVNDVAIEASGRSRAMTVVDEIRSDGGEAVASDHDITLESDGARLVDLAVETFGRVDILIHNAGLTLRTMREQGAGEIDRFADTNLDLVRKNIELNLMSAFYVGQPAWSAMAENEYGRMLFTTSPAIFGAPTVSAYSASKAGLLGLVASLALEASESGQDIAVNALAPEAATAPHHEAEKARFQGLLTPDNIAPVAVFLVSNACRENGRCFSAGGTYIGRIFVALTRGWASGDLPLTPETVAAHFDEAVALDEFVVPTSTVHAKNAMLQVVVPSDNSDSDWT